MQVLFSPLMELEEFKEAKKARESSKDPIAISGCTQDAKLHVFSALSQNCEIRIIITHSEIAAREILDNIRFYDRSAMYFPAKDIIFYQADIFGNRITAERMKVFKGILENNITTIVTTIDAFMAPIVPVQVLKSFVLEIKKGAFFDEQKIAKKLVRMGYQNVGLVTEPGQFSVRGGIMDIYDLTKENPVRIELWGDEVESIRSFDVLSQRSIEKLGFVSLYPATEMVMDEDDLFEGLKNIEKEAEEISGKLRKQFRTEEAHRITATVRNLREQVEEFEVYSNLESYIRYFYPSAGRLSDLFYDKSVSILLDEPLKVDSHGKAVEAEFRDSMIHRLEKGYVLPGQMDLLFSLKETYADLLHFPITAMSVLDVTKSILPIKKRFSFQTFGVSSYNGSVPELMRDLKRFRKNGYRVLLLSGSKTRAKRIAEDITREGVSAFYSENMQRDLEPGQIMVSFGHVGQGFEYPLLQFVVLTDTDIFGKEKKSKAKKKKYNGAGISSLSELKPGDYVVHENYGVGIYRGIEKVTVDHITKDYMKISYAGDSVLYVLATNFDQIQKYASSEGKKPRINKLGTQEWNKTKSRVRESVAGVAKELVELYAERQNTKAYQYPPDTPWQKEFEELFPYEETEDQLAAIEATKADMESDKIMERLICGDVGYGKTEIAIRAAFKAVMEGRQVIYLVPTTILAQQHYNTFVQRMKDYPVKIELLCRFRSNAEQKKTVDRLKKGLVDIVIATHRVLSKDVETKNLGLLIIDEEQRFGVAHKEKIKKMRKDVDVLTLSATPIPRTLHMSLVGIRDMSLLEEPPQDRMPIQTFVMEYNEETVREAIVREINRGGQVYFVYNRVAEIADVAATVQSLVPEARVDFAHGQMSETQLEDIMYEFMNGEIDVLVSTTIIETGLDISNVNTIIIADSDRLGLAQLYQLRGRVGRSNRIAYAFLMYRKDKIISEVAEKRLQAIREFTDLGSGFKISMRDLEIRGAGNLLGMKQSGHMEAVGYELYCKMLNDAVGKLKGKVIEETPEPEINLDVDAYLPAEYIVNEVQKLDMYTKIASIEGKNDYEEMREELLDRFGNIPRCADYLLRISLIKAKARKLYITEIKGKAGKLTVIMLPTAPVKTEKLTGFMQEYGKQIRFLSGKETGFELKFETYDLVEKDAEVLLKRTEQFLIDMEILF